jgi:hypothetical protein
MELAPLRFDFPADARRPPLHLLDAIFVDRSLG